MCPKCLVFSNIFKTVQTISKFIEAKYLNVYILYNFRRHAWIQKIDSVRGKNQWPITDNTRLYSRHFVGVDPKARDSVPDYMPPEPLNKRKTKLAQRTLGNHSHLAFQSVYDIDFFF